MILTAVFATPRTIVELWQFSTVTALNETNCNSYNMNSVTPLKLHSSKINKQSNKTILNQKEDYVSILQKDALFR